MLLKYLSGVLIGLFALLFILLVLVQFSGVQTWLAGHLTRHLASRTGTTISIERLAIGIPAKFSMDGLYVEDHRGDTLLYAGSIDINIRLLALARNNIRAARINIGDATFRMVRQEPDSLFNLDLFLNSLQTGTDENNEPGGTGTAWSFDIGKLEFRDAAVLFSDHISGMELDVRLGLLSTSADELLLEKNTFSLGSTIIANGRVSLVMVEGSRESPPPDEKEAEMPKIGLERLRIDNVSFYYGDEDGVVADTYLGNLDIMPRYMDLESMTLALEYIRASEAVVSFGEMELAGISMDIGEVFASPDSLSFIMSGLSGKQMGGIELKNLSAVIQTGSTTRVEGLLLETSESFLAGDFSTSIPLLDPAGPMFSPQYAVSADISRAVLGRDLMLLVPELEMIFPDNLAPSINLVARAEGVIGDIAMETFYLEVPDRFTFTLDKAEVKGLPDAAGLLLRLPDIRLYGHPGSIIPYIPGGPYDEFTDLPDSIDLKASWFGSLDNFEAGALLDMDAAHLEVAFNYRDPGTGVPDWSAGLKLQGSHPLSLIGLDTLIQDLSLSAESSGVGFDPASMEFDLDLVVDSVFFNNYNYRNLFLSAVGSKGVTEAAIRYDDDNLKLVAENTIDFSQDYPKFDIIWELDHLNALELGFSDELIAVQTLLRGSGRLGENDFPEGRLFAGPTHLLLDREVFTLDSLLVLSSRQNGSFLMEIISPIVRGEYRGNISPVSLPDVLSAYFSEYLEPDTLLPAYTEAPMFDLKLNVFPSPYFTELLIPAIDSFEPLSLNAGFDSRTGILSADATIPDISIAGWHFQNISINAESDPGQMELSLHLPALGSDQLALSNILLNAVISDSEAAFGISFDDGDGIQWLDIAGITSFQDGYTRISLDDIITVNRQEWGVSSGNYIRLANGGITAGDFILSSEGKQIDFFSSDPSVMDSPLELHFDGIDLGQFDLWGGTQYIGGVFDASVVASGISGDLSFEADVAAKHLSYKGDTIGDIDLHLTSSAPGIYSVIAGISGYGNRVSLEGFYRQDTETPLMDVELSLARLELSTLEAITSDDITELQGDVSGNLRVSGNPGNPEIDGRIDFASVGFRIPFLSTSYTIVEESIVFDGNRIGFDNFTLLDRSGRTASLDGQLSTTGIESIGFDLRLTSGNFLLMDIGQGQNEMFYGRLLIDTDIGIAGDLSRPVIEGSMKLNQGSRLSVIPPQSVPETIGDEGVVEFIAVHEDLFPDLVSRPADPVLMTTGFENLDVSLNFELDPQTEVVVIIDQVAGDQLELRGGGLLSFGLDPGGRISLAGRYEISQGAYQMTFYDVVRRNFSIESGSNIVWTGDPMDARMDITAKYTIRTSPRELMTSHSGAATHQEVAFRQIYPFDVFLYMRGELMSPDISFNISLPPEHRGAMEGRLEARVNELGQNESELNKQVFALLILGNFIQDDPISAVTSGPGLSSTARTSASRILSQQLNRLSGKYIRGVDINFELESYEGIEEGQVVGRTELQMEVSRDFMDQRLRITAGGHFELEDETRRQLDPSDIAGDFSVEYLLDPSGRYTIRGYRERRFQDVFDGELIESGVSLIFRQTFDSFREIFIRKEEETVITDE